MLRKKNYEFPPRGRKGSVTERICASRGIKLEEILNDVPMRSPWLIDGMGEAVGEVMKAIESSGRIAILGDYDTDGITASAVMKKGLELLGAEADVFTPDRLKEGYGLNERIVRETNEGGYALAVTVDCGIRDGKWISRLECPCVVTDHHEQAGELPDCAAVIDCSRKDNTYPFPGICGAVMAYKLIQALCEKCGMKGREEFLLPYAAIGTIGDVMELRDENRTIVKKGLAMIERTGNPGLRELLETGLEGRPLTAENIAFYVSPMINASSRVGDVRVVKRLLFTASEQEAKACCALLKKYNEQRKQMTEEYMAQAGAKLAGCMPDGQAPVIVSGKWHKGIIGIMAGRLAELLDRPCAVIDEETLTGSCRSAGGRNVMEWMDAASGCLSRYGGHEGAAGFSVKSVRAIDEMRRQSEAFAAKAWKEPPKEAGASRIDAELDASEISLETLAEVERLEPFGQGNPKPLFVLRGAEMKSLRRCGEKPGSEGMTLQAETADGIRGVGFGIGGLSEIMKSGDRGDVVFTLERNEWRGNATAQMVIEDIVPGKKRKRSVSRLPDADDARFIAAAAWQMMARERPYVTSPETVAALAEAQGAPEIPDPGRLLKCLDEAGAMSAKETGSGEVMLLPPAGRQKMPVSRTPEFVRWRKEFESERRKEK